jgi:hypothetical protein
MRIFLDIDGVMVPARGWEKPVLLEDGFPAFSTKAVLALAEIVRSADTVVLTTSHRTRFTVEQWKHIFMHRGLPLESMELLPEYASKKNRREELQHWFHDNWEDEPFVIIDDDKSLHDLPQTFKERWIETSPYVGLTPDHVSVVQGKVSRHAGSVMSSIQALSESLH